MKHRIVALLLALLLLLSACNAQDIVAPFLQGGAQSTQPAEKDPSAAQSTKAPIVAVDFGDYTAYRPIYPPQRSDEHVDDYQYVRPLLEDCQKLMQDFCKELPTIQTGPEQVGAYVALEQAFLPIYDMRTMASVNYFAQVNDENQAESDYVDELFSDLAPESIEVLRTILASEHLDAFAVYFGKEFVEDIQREVDQYDPAMVELGKKINKLSSDYTRVITDIQTRGIVLGEDNFTERDLRYYLIFAQDDEEIGATIAQLLADYYQEMNDACDGIYTQLIKNRIEMANLAGFDNYIDYYLDGTGYDQAMMRDFVKSIKETFLPVYTQVEDEIFEKAGKVLGRAPTAGEMFMVNCPPAMRVSASYYDALDTQQEAEQRIYDTATQLLRELMPETKELVNYLEEHGLYDVFAAESKRTGGFSTVFWGKQHPYVFSNSADVDTIIHESGHALEFFHMPQVDSTSRFSAGTDVMEVSSMALEMLAMQKYDLLYGDTAQAARLVQLYTALITILNQTMFYEFEIAMYDDPDMSSVKRSALYAKLMQEYGLTTRGDRYVGLDGPAWVNVLHFFTSSLYTIDYTIAQLVSLDIWERSGDDAQMAQKAYVDFVFNTTQADLFARLEVAGLGDPFDKVRQEELADRLREEFAQPAYIEGIEDALKSYP